MTRASLYCGPGKFYMGSSALWTEGENGQITLALDQEALPIASGFFGRVDSQQGDCVIRITMTPFDSWAALTLVYPTKFKTPDIGARLHGAADVPAKIWTPDGRLWEVKAAALTKPPELHLGNGKAFFGQCEFLGIIADDHAYGASGSFMDVTESAAADPGGQFTLSDFVRGVWTGVWSTAEGFGGGVGDVAIQAEEEWVITPQVTVNQFKVQGLTRVATLASVSYMAKCRPVGPTHTEILGALGIQGGGVLGERKGGSGAADLVLSGPNSKTITLKNARPVGAGFEFGGTRLGTGEVGFVNGLTFTAGVAQPLIVFSA